MIRTFVRAIGHSLWLYFLHYRRTETSQRLLVTKIKDHKFSDHAKSIVGLETVTAGRHAQCCCEVPRRLADAIIAEKFVSIFVVLNSIKHTLLR